MTFVDELVSIGHEGVGYELLEVLLAYSVEGLSRNNSVGRVGKVPYVFGKFVPKPKYRTQFVILGLQDLGIT